MEHKLPKNKRVGSPKWKTGLETDVCSVSKSQIRSRTGNRRVGHFAEKAKTRAVSVSRTMARQGKAAFDSLRPLVRLARERALPAIWRAALVLLELVGRAADEVASLPWKALAEKIFNAPTRLLGRVAHLFPDSPLTASIPVECRTSPRPRKLRGWMVLAVALTGLIAIAVLIACLLIAEHSGPRPVFGARNAIQIQETARPATAGTNPLWLELDGPITEAKAYPLDERPGLIVDVSSRGSTLGLGVIRSTHPLVKHIEAMPYNGGTRFVILMNEGNPMPKWRLHSEGKRVSLEFLDT